MAKVKQQAAEAAANEKEQDEQQGGTGDGDAGGDEQKKRKKRGGDGEAGLAKLAMQVASELNKVAKIAAMAANEWIRRVEDQVEEQPNVWRCRKSGEDDEAYASSSPSWRRRRSRTRGTTCDATGESRTSKRATSSAPPLSTRLDALVPCSRIPPPPSRLPYRLHGAALAILASSPLSYFGL